MKKIYTKEIRQFILENYKNVSSEQLAKLVNDKFNINATRNTMRCYKTNHKLASGYKHKNPKRKYTDEQINFLRIISKGLGNKETAGLFNQHFGTNYSEEQIKNIKSNYGISSGLTGYFPKGNVSFNKGKKWNEFMSEKGMLNSLKTTFKKGNKSHNCDPIGTEKWKSDHKNRDDIGFLYVKVQDGKKQNNWKQKHRLIWEEANGPIPRGHKVIFADGDRTHIELSNLILVSNSQMLIMNRRNLIYSDPEATETGSLIAKVIDKTNKVRRSKKEKICQ